MRSWGCRRSTMVQVIKVGGAALTDAAWLERFADAVAVRAGASRVIVHGGGPEINELSAKLGVTTQFQNGRRVTSEAGLDITSMVLNGRINKRIVRALRARNLDAFGLSGEDGGVIVGKLTDGGLLGRVGDVIAVRTSLLQQLIALGLLPVLSPVSLGTDEGALNINADEVATAVAQKMGADELLFLTDVAGVLDNGTAIDALSAPEALQLIARDVATGGMALKLRAAVSALNAGVAQVRVGSLEMLWDANAGTTIHAEESRVGSPD
jgi:acetylglutamate kinase